MTEKIKNKSTYKTKNGTTMRQINLAVKEETFNKFVALCDGLSKSVIFTQMVNKECADKVLEVKEANPVYSILGE